MVSSKQFCDLVNDLWNNGEMMKAYIVARHVPAILEDDEEVLTLTAKLEKQLRGLTIIQNTGNLDGAYVRELIDPPDSNQTVKFQLLKKYVKEYGLKRLLDVGCFSGWIGRALSIEGIKVVGIDIHPIALCMAAIKAGGSLAEFECLSALKVGYVHPRSFDGAVVFDTLEHLGDPVNAIESINRSVKKDGWVFINVPSPKGELMAKRQSLENHEHYYCFSKRTLKSLVGHFKNYELQEIENEEGGVNWFLKYQV